MTHGESNSEVLTTRQAIWDNVWATASIGEELDSLSEIMLGELARLLPTWEGVSVLEAGCGSGRISLRLSRRGANVTLLDLSSEAIRLAVRGASEWDARPVQGDLLNLPFRSGTFSVTWNGGVLEHLRPEELETAVSEMSRVTKRNGFVVSFNPNRKSVAYRIGKRLQERSGDWIYGYEEPIRSLSDVFRRQGVEMLREFDFGVSHSLAFIPQLPKRLLHSTSKLERILHRVGMRGYLLVSIGRRVR